MGGMACIAGVRLRILPQLMALLLVAACGGDYDGPGLPPLDADARILAFGDSLTYGTGADASEAYPAQLERLSGREVINAGVPGETTAEGRERLPGVLEDTDPDLVLLCLGGNDLLQRRPRSAMVENLRAMIETVEERGIPLVLIAVPELSGLSVKPQPVYAELAAEHELPLAESSFADVLGKGRLRSDAVHPNARGYRLVAEDLHELLRAAGALR